MVRCIDAQYIPNIGYLGCYTLNTNIDKAILDAQINNDLFDKLSDVLLYLSMATVIPFAAIGIRQLIKNKSLAKVDPVIYFILLAYILSVVHYVTFMFASINASPLSTIDDIKLSYPSTHTFIFITYLFVGLTGLLRYVKVNKNIKILLIVLFSILSVIMMVLRLLSRQHYFTDVLGGALLACINIAIPYALYSLTIKNKEAVL